MERKTTRAFVVTYRPLCSTAVGLTAMLEVVKRFGSHDEAAQWYRDKGLPLPSNCMVRGNPPLPLRRTHGVSRCGELKKWDEHYQQRADDRGVFLACKPLWLDLHDPPAITRREWELWGGAPTRTPKNTPHLWEPLWAFVESRSSTAGP